MEGAARDRLVAVRRCGGTPMRLCGVPRVLASWTGSAVLGIPSVLLDASWLRPDALLLAIPMQI